MATALLLLAVLASAPARADGDDLLGLAAQTAAATRGTTARLSAGARAERRADAAATPIPWTRDLSSQFPDAGGNQGAIGDCHDFSAVSIVEAALRRGTGSVWSLSVADLFVQHTILGPLFFTSMVRTNGAPVEGGFETDDASYMIQHGVAMRLSYSRFQADYARYRQNVLLPEEKKILQELPLVGEGAVDSAMIMARQASDAELALKTYRAMNRVLEKLDLRAAQERAQVRRALGGYRVAVEWFKGASPKDYQGMSGPPGPAVIAAHKRCYFTGSTRAALIRRELDAGRPVAVDLDIAGLIQMNSNGTPSAMPPESQPSLHAVVIEGYAPLGTGHLYKVRNWWGSKNIGAEMIGGRIVTGLLHDDEMCRVRQMTSVLAPGENSVLPVAVD